MINHDENESPKPLTHWTHVGKGEQWSVMNNFGQTIAFDLHEDDAKQIADAFNTNTTLTAENAKLREFAAFAKCTINSGEPWTETCEKMFTEALKGGE